MLEQNELVRQYTLYYSTLYFLRGGPDVMELSQGDGDGSEPKYDGESAMQNNEVRVYVCVYIYILSNKCNLLEFNK